MSKTPAIDTLIAAANVRGWTITERPDGQRVPACDKTKNEGRNSYLVQFDRPADWPVAGGMKRIVVRVDVTNGAILGSDRYDKPSDAEGYQVWQLDADGYRMERTATARSVDSLARDLDPGDRQWEQWLYKPPAPVYGASVRVDHAEGALILTIADPDDTFKTLCTVVLDPDQAIEFGAAVAQHVAYSMSDLLHHLATGACPTCKNLRLVNGGKERCPDCADRWNDRKLVRTEWLRSTPFLKKAHGVVQAALDANPWR